MEKPHELSFIVSIPELHILFKKINTLGLILLYSLLVFLLYSFIFLLLKNTGLNCLILLPSVKFNHLWSSLFSFDMLNNFIFICKAWYFNESPGTPGDQRVYPWSRSNTPFRASVWFLEWQTNGRSGGVLCSGNVMDILNNHLSAFSTQKTHQANHVGNKKEKKQLLSP